MKAYNTFRSIVFALSTATTFLFWYIISKIMADSIWLGVLLSGIISLGVYRVILKTMELLLVNFKPVKIFVFGSSYLEGIWVGCFLGDDGTPQYYIESFEQDFNGLVIRGRNFYADKSFKGTWISEKVIIDDEKGRIIYTYTTEMIYNTHKNQGLAEFNFDRPSINKPPNRMVGFSSDVFNPKKFFSIEERILGKECIDEAGLLNKAISVYENNKEAFAKHVINATK